MNDEDQAPSAAVARSILPVLKTYTSSEVAIVGCHSLNMSRPSCEYDLLIVTTEDELPVKSLKVADAYVDMVFRTQRQVKESADPEFSVLLSAARPIRDNSWLLATASSESKKTIEEHCKRSAQQRLGWALKALGRVDENLANGAVRDADFWLLSAGYEFCHAALYSNGVVPSPSHLLTQMKRISRKAHSNFRQWSESVGLALASRASCENRLGGIEILYDVLRTVELEPGLTRALARYRSPESVELVTRKAVHLLDSREATEAYSYLGYETVMSLRNFLEYHSNRLRKEPEYPSIVENLTKGKDRIISDDVILSLGLVRSKEIVKSAADALIDAVSGQAKRI